MHKHCVPAHAAFDFSHCVANINMIIKPKKRLLLHAAFTLNQDDTDWYQSHQRLWHIFFSPWVANILIWHDVCKGLMRV